MKGLPIDEATAADGVRDHGQGTSRMSLGGFSVAIVGAYIAFLPLMQILLPLKAAAIAPHGAARLLGMVAACGAVVAGIANVGVGWLSDRTTSRFGRRRPWIIAGVMGIAVSDAAIWQSHSVIAFVAAFALFQLMFNTAFSPLLALVSDRVPANRRGWASALAGLGEPIGTVVGTVVVGTLFTQEGDRFLALGVMVVATIMPFAWRLGADTPLPGRVPVAADPVAQPRAATRWLTRAFVLAWIARVCVVMAFIVAQLYILFYLQAIMPDQSPRAVQRALAVLAIVFGVVSAGAGVVAGRISDHIGRRRPFVLCSALTVSVAMAALAIAPSWPLTVAAYALFAAGAGVHTAVEFAMIVDILPSRDRAARDLGILNLSNIVPQIIAPLTVTWIVSLPGSGIQWAFGAAAIAAAAGAILVGFMRAVP